MHTTDIRSSKVSLEIREKKYIIKHVNSVLDSKQFKKAHATAVNVVCAQVASTQDMWNNDTKVINSFDREDNYIEEEEEEDEEDVQSPEARTPRQQYSPSLYDFHFEFGSKRPPTAAVCPSSDEEEEEQEDEGNEKIETEEYEDEVTYDSQELDSELSQDERDWQMQHDDVMEDTRLFPSATDEALQVYENITDNIYIGSATGRSMAEESMPCECKYDSELDNPSEACGDDNLCINRMMFMECIVQDCPCGRLCRNRRFQLGQYAPIDVIRTERKGFGLRALTDLPSNSFIMEYIGEVIPQIEFIRRTREYDAEGFKHYYFMTLKNDEIIDATRRGCLARFMNHSCNPNCVTQKWVIGKKMRIGIFTSREVKEGEELTFDYKFERYGAIAQKCYCGESNCKGFIGASDEKVMDEEVLTDTNMNTAFSASSSDDDDYDNEDSEEEDLDVVTIQRAQPLQDPKKVQSFVKRMLNSVGKPRLVNKLLMRLKMTNVDNSHGREIFKMIVRLHGLKMLKFWLGEWKNNETIVLKALQVLEKLPLANRNGLEDCKLFEVVQKYVDHDNEEISALAENLLEEWNELKCIYRIPKRTPIQPDDILDEEDEEVSVNEEEEEIIKVVTRKKNGQTKRKRIKYESSREYFDPDNDYYEYFPMQITAEEILSRIRYPPRFCLIPTAPKAMLDSSAIVQQPKQYFNNKYKKHTPQSNVYFSYNNTISPLSTANTNTTTGTPIDTYNTTNSTNNFDNSHATNTMQQDQVTGDTSLDSYTQYYYAVAAAAGMTIEEYYYAYQQPTTILPPLPPNWQAAVTMEGSTYFYNVSTQQTQWEVPICKESPPPPPPPPPPLPMIDSLQLENSNTMTNESSSPVDIQDLLTPATSGSVDGNPEDGSYLNDVDLKLEVGKVVTKYLSSKQQLLWKGDKVIFKDLARKVTHHIVDKEIKSGRKIKVLDTALRIKIEKFIDAYGADYVTKFMQRNPSISSSSSPSTK